METLSQFVSTTANLGTSSRVASTYPQLNILFVGPDAQSLFTQTSHLTLGHLASADSFIEAILVSAQGPKFNLIIAGISQDLSQLQRAVESLHSVNPQARLVLLTHPADEPQARKALNWGANDYEILPAQLATILKPFLQSTQTPRPVIHTPTAEPAPKAKISLTSLPLVLEASLIEAILQGRQDILQRAVSTLQAYLTWPGKLSFLAPDHSPILPAQVPENAILIQHENQIFGTLQLQIDAHQITPAIRAQLSQSATWLAAWAALSQQNTQLRTLSITDELSGAYNRRYFTRFTTGLLSRARDQRFRVTMLLFDIDNFKTYNDRFGHPAGDEIIRQLITLLRRCTRERDLVARIGGDEFAVIFWDSEAPRHANSDHPRDVVAATERFRKAIAAHQWEERCKIKGSVSISGGIASFPWDAENFDQLLATADAALLKAKAAGKNVIEFSSQPNTTATPTPSQV